MEHICGRRVCVTLNKSEEDSHISPKIQCERCGFHPEEQKRRLSEGRFTEDGITIIDHRVLNEGRTDCEIISGLKTLRFPRKAETV